MKKDETRLVYDKSKMEVDESPFGLSKIKDVACLSQYQFPDKKRKYFFLPIESF